MKSIFFIIIWFNSLLAFGQVFNPNIKQELQQIPSALTTLQEFEDLGIKGSGTAALAATRDWLVGKYAEIGYQSVSLDTFIWNSDTMQNVVVRKPGLSDDYIIVCSHYDTRGGPGVNDNGTGVAATMEAARTLYNLTTERTVYFVHFAAEEDGFHGSSHMVNNLSELSGDLYAVFNIDQLGGTLGQADNNRIYCERDEINTPSENNALSFQITDTIVNLARLYTSIKPEISSAFSSDYIPFQNAGHVITGLYQFSNFPQRHSILDSLAVIDTGSFAEAVKLSVAMVLYFAQVPRFVSVKNIIRQDEDILISFTQEGKVRVVINQGQEKEDYRLNIWNLPGQSIKTYPLENQDNLLILKDLRSGFYIGIVESRFSGLRKSFFISIP